MTQDLTCIWVYFMAGFIKPPPPNFWLCIFCTSVVMCDDFWWEIHVYSRLLLWVAPDPGFEIGAAAVSMDRFVNSHVLFIVITVHLHVARLSRDLICFCTMSAPQAELQREPELSSRNWGAIMAGRHWRKHFPQHWWPKRRKKGQGLLIFELPTF